MTSRARLLAVSTLALASFAIAAPAHAHGGAEEPSKEKAEPGKPGVGDKKEEGKEKAPFVDVSADVVVGFGKVPALNQALPSSLGIRPASQIDRSKVTVDSYQFGAGFRLGERLRVFGRIPFANASIRPDTVKDSRSALAFGNFEIGAGMTAPEDKPVAFLPKFALALPTSSGQPLPNAEEVARNPSGDYGRAARDEYAALLSANGSRGYEDSALYASKRLGLTPSIEVRVHAGKLELVPFAAVAVLVSTASHPEKRVAGDVVGGAELAVPAADWLDLALRAFINVPFAKEERSDAMLAVAEPQVRFHLGPVKPYVGVLLPFLPAGTHATDVVEGGAPAFDPRMIAIRLGASAAF